MEVPLTVRSLPGVREAKAKDANGHDPIVGTLSKLGDAFARGDLSPFDVLLVDEAYQADSAKYFAVGGLAPVHLLVGDAGHNVLALPRRAVLLLVNAHTDVADCRLAFVLHRNLLSGWWVVIRPSSRTGRARP